MRAYFSPTTGGSGSINPSQPIVQGSIGKSTVKVILGDLTRIEADAYMVPEFRSGASEGGVGGAIMRSGGSSGIAEYDRIIKEKGDQPFGEVHLTKSGGGKSKFLLHVVTVGSGKEYEFSTIQKAVYKALHIARNANIKSIAAPALGTGIIGQLTPEQSAKAMSAIYQFSNEGGEADISLVIYGDKNAHKAFSNVLQSGSYKSVIDQPGQKEIDFVTWVEGITRDAQANDQFRIERN